MQTFPVFLISLVMAAWTIASALLSVQNAIPVSLKFLNFQSIQMPVGFVLGTSAGIGLLGGALMQSLARRGDRSVDPGLGGARSEGRSGSYAADNEEEW